MRAGAWEPSAKNSPPKYEKREKNIKLRALRAFVVIVFKYYRITISG
jgi:hypothetical protein